MSTNATRPRVSSRRAIAKFVAMVVTPTPPLGEYTRNDFAALGLFGGAAAQSPSGGGAGTAQLAGAVTRRVAAKLVAPVADCWPVLRWKTA